MLSKKEAKVVRGLIEGETKQTLHVTRTGMSSAGEFACIVSSDDTSWSPVATSTDGMIVTDSERARFKFLEIKGYFDVAPLATTSAAGGLPLNDPYVVRELLVWYYKPKHQPDAGGNGPSTIASEVLISSAVESMTVSDADNSGRFKVLSDRVMNLGSNVYIAASNTMKETSKQRFDFTRKIMIDKSQHYKAAPTDTNKGGHYDSDVDAGQVTRGLCVLYYIVTGNAGTLTSVVTTRLTYVA